MMEKSGGERGHDLQKMSEGRLRLYGLKVMEKDVGEIKQKGREKKRGIRFFSARVFHQALFFFPYFLPSFHLDRILAAPAWKEGFVVSKHFPFFDESPSLPLVCLSVCLSVLPSTLFAHLWTQPACGAAIFLCSLSAFYYSHLSLSLFHPLFFLPTLSLSLSLFLPSLFGGTSRSSTVCCLQRNTKAGGVRHSQKKLRRRKRKKEKRERERKLSCIPANPFLIHFHPVRLFSDEVRAKSVGPLSERYE